MFFLIDGHLKNANINSLKANYISLKISALSSKYLYVIHDYANYTRRYIDL